MASQTANQIKAYLANILPNLNSSASAIWTRFVDVFSTIIDILTGEIGRSNTIIETAARSLRVMGQQYYIDKALAYQEGDDLVVVNDETLAMGYAETDTSKQIIKQVYTSVPDNGEIYLKVATTDSDNNLIPLTAQQLDAFKGYMKNWEPVGIAVTVFSQVPDRFDCAHLYVRYSRDYNLIAIQDNIKALLDQFQMQRLNRSALSTALPSTGGTHPKARASTSRMFRTTWHPTPIRESSTCTPDISISTTIFPTLRRIVP